MQDVVHLGVKLKARFLMPSIILPLGNYLATNAHFQMVVKLYGKEKHGLRARDIDHRDKQNFDAVGQLIKASHLLDELPEAVGTKYYMNVMKSVVDSYLDKSLDTAKRIKEIWYAAFFLQYWRHWILLHPLFSLQKNFITSNAYMCVEINAHSLLAITFLLRDEMKANSECFLPWMLGSQSCERVFRSLRSMTGTFSTVVNFSLLGMLQRLHKLYIQEECQSKTGSASGICFPRQEKYGRKKDGNKQYEKFSIDISNQEIYEAMKEAETRAKDSMETLCMAEDLKQQKLWDIPPIPTHLVPHNDENDSAENEEETEEEKGDDFQDPFIYSTESISDLSNDVSQLYNSKAVDVSVKMKVENMKKRKGKKIPFKKLECQGDGRYSHVQTKHQ